MKLAPLQPSLAQKVMFSSSLTVVQQAVVMVSAVIVARLVGPETLGLLAYAGAFVGLFTSLSDFGFGSAHVKRISEGLDLGTCMGTMLSAKVVSLVIMTATVLGVYFYGAHASFASEEQRYVFFLALATLAVGQLGMIANTTLVAFQDVLRKDIPPTLVQAGNALLRIAVALLGLGAAGLATVDLFTSVLLVLAYVWLLRGVPLALPRWAAFKSYAAFAAPMFLVALVTSVGERMDRVLLQSFAGLAAVGQYSAGMRFSVPLRSLSGATGSLIFPSMSRAFAEDRPDKAFALCARAERQLALVLFPVMLAVAGVAGPAALAILGPRYSDTGPVIAFGVMAMTFQSLTQPYAQMIIGSGRMVLSVAIYGTMLAVQVGALYFFLGGPGAAYPGLGGGAGGAAVAGACSAIVGAVVWRASAARFIQAPMPRRFWIHVASALTLFVIAYAAESTQDTASVGAGPVISVGAVALHLLILRLTGELDRDEVVNILGLIFRRHITLREALPTGSGAPR